MAKLPRLNLAVVFGVLALSVGVNVAQASKIRSMVLAVENGSELVGTRAVPVVGYSLAGQPIRLAARQPVPVVLYYFSKTCSWCDRNWQNVERLSAEAAGRYRVLALSADRGLRGYAEAKQLEVEIVEGISEQMMQAYSLVGTPHTIVVDADGMITHEWRGAYVDRVRPQIEELFGLRLPGVASPKRSVARSE